MPQLVYPVPAKHVHFEDEEPRQERRHHRVHAHHHHRHHHVQIIPSSPKHTIYPCYEEVVVQPAREPRHHHPHPHDDCEEIRVHYRRRRPASPPPKPSPTPQCPSCYLPFPTRTALASHIANKPKHCPHHLACFADWTKHCFDYDHIKCPRSSCRDLAPFASRQKCLEHLRAWHGR